MKEVTSTKYRKVLEKDLKMRISDGHLVARIFSVQIKIFGSFAWECLADVLLAMSLVLKRNTRFIQ